ncbi:hypothetical protein A6770_22750 [Nostoc minutum NIES-26]|uniref:TIR domain-containing protein n=1 Tax=Nostoc minutum NIES-26 TaxID=1844469 RepID=A0A367QY20_9NOSO|nr:hypothetical protein A6770_22750 [Nostoc minutum NIES-26]
MLAKKLIKVFYCCSDSAKDKEKRQKIEEHLSSLKWGGVIEQWHSDMISPGKEREKEIDKHLKSAEIVLILISSEFIASYYHWEVLRRQAMEQHRKQISRVILILLYPVDDYWRKCTFPKIKVLPDNKRPITKRRLHDDAFTNIAKGIREVAEELIDPTYHIKKYLRQIAVGVMLIVKTTANTSIYLARETLSSFANLFNQSRYHRHRRSNNILVIVFVGLSVVTVIFILQSRNISEIPSSDPSVIPRSEPSPILSSTQIRNSTGWIRIGKVNNTSGSLTDGEPLLETSISTPVIPSSRTVVTVKYEVDLRKGKSSSSQFLQKLKPGEKVIIFNVEPIGKSSQNSPSIEVMAQVRKCNQTCK